MAGGGPRYCDVGERDLIGIDRLLRGARRQLCRLAPEEVPRALRAGAVLLDIRSDSQRATDGTVTEAIVVCRNVLEWRCDPSSPWRDPRVSDPRRRVMLLCDEGYQSSLAAACLQGLGLVHATDVIGGFKAWRRAGLPIARSEPAGRQLAGAVVAAAVAAPPRTEGVP
jgi:rhodanese-related sulfurtransferase